MQISVCPSGYFFSLALCLIPYSVFRSNMDSGQHRVEVILSLISSIEGTALFPRLWRQRVGGFGRPLPRCRLRLKESWGDNKEIRSRARAPALRAARLPCSLMPLGGRLRPASAGFAPRLAAALPLVRFLRSLSRSRTKTEQAYAFRLRNFLQNKKEPRRHLSRPTVLFVQSR